MAFPARNIEVSYVRPAFVGEMLELGSWVEELGKSSFEVRVIVAGADDCVVRALAEVHFVTVDAGSGKVLPVPDVLPSSASSNPLAGMPATAAYQSTVTGLPERWVSSV